MRTQRQRNKDINYWNHLANHIDDNRVLICSLEPAYSDDLVEICRCGGHLQTLPSMPGGNEQETKDRFSSSQAKDAIKFSFLTHC